MNTVNNVNTGHPTTIVLLDPTSPDGEAAIDALTEDDRHVAVVVLLSGRTSAALREYAAVEDLALADAGWIYLDQVADRVQRGDRLVETVLATGPDPATELAMLASGRPLARIVLPPSMERLDHAGVERAAELAPVQVAAPVLAHH